MMRRSDARCCSRVEIVVLLGVVICCSVVRNVDDVRRSFLKFVVLQ